MGSHPRTRRPRQNRPAHHALPRRADALASRIVVLAKGRVVCEGTPAAIKARGASRLHPGQRPSAPPQTREPASGPVKQIACSTALPDERLRKVSGVLDTSHTANRTTLTTDTAEDTLRELLALDPTLSDLHITSPALEEAFLALTAQEHTANH